MWDFTARDERDTETLGTALGKSLAQGGLSRSSGRSARAKRGSCSRSP